MSTDIDNQKHDINVIWSQYTVSKYFQKRYLKHRPYIVYYILSFKNFRQNDKCDYSAINHVRIKMYENMYILWDPAIFTREREMCHLSLFVSITFFAMFTVNRVRRCLT